MKLRFELYNCDIEVVDYEGEETEYQIDRDLNLFDDYISNIKDKVGDKLYEIDDYRYELYDLTENEFDYIQALLENLDEEFQICFLSLSYEE